MQKPEIRVSNLLRPISLQKYSKIPPHVLEKAAEDGTKIHKYIEYFLQNKKIEDFEQNEKVQMGIESFNFFKENFDFPENFDLEKKYEHEFKNFILIGTVDFISEDYVLDWKTRANLSTNDNFMIEKLQCELYCFLTKRKNYKIVILSKNAKKFKLIESEKFDHGERNFLQKILKEIILDKEKELNGISRNNAGEA